MTFRFFVYHAVPKLYLAQVSSPGLILALEDSSSVNTGLAEMEFKCLHFYLINFFISL